MSLSQAQAENKALQESKKDGGKAVVLLSEYNYESQTREWYVLDWAYWYPKQSNPEYLFLNLENIAKNGEWTDSI
jgi:hypothetical protein